MCAVSMVIDQWQHPLSPNKIDWTQTLPAPATAEQMLKVIALLEEIDKKLGAQNCKLEAEEKRSFKRKLQRRARRK